MDERIEGFLSENLLLYMFFGFCEWQ